MYEEEGMHLYERVAYILCLFQWGTSVTQYINMFYLSLVLQFLLKRAVNNHSHLRTG